MPFLCLLVEVFSLPGFLLLAVDIGHANRGGVGGIIGGPSLLVVFARELLRTQLSAVANQRTTDDLCRNFAEGDSLLRRLARVPRPSGTPLECGYGVVTHTQGCTTLRKATLKAHAWTYPRRCRPASRKQCQCDSFACSSFLKLFLGIGVSEIPGSNHFVSFLQILHVAFTKTSRWRL